MLPRGCNSRSIVSLIQDNKIKRENVFILGIPCPGVIDLSKIEKVTGRDRDEIDDISINGDKIAVTIAGNKQEFAAKEVLFDNCLHCETPTPKEYDALIGKQINARPKTAENNLNKLREKLPKSAGGSGKKSSAAASAVTPAAMSAPPASANAASWKKASRSGCRRHRTGRIIYYSS